MLLGIDYGTKRIGLALGEALPRGAGVLATKTPNLFSELRKICEDNDVEKIIIGLPTLPSGDEGSLAFDVRKFAKEIEEVLGIVTSLEPEGFTSTEAEQILKDQKISFDRDSGKIDETAAVLILEQYINRKQSKSSTQEIFNGE